VKPVHETPENQYSDKIQMFENTESAVREKKRSSSHKSAAAMATIMIQRYKDMILEN
jgi:hypothetical protein